ncbi:MASP2 protease, partial [Atractosteus spatula]|nr:MASP2 protease [Atractosteus spatula]
MYKTVIRPVLLYGAECLAVGKREENLMRRTEMRMLRWILQISMKDKIRNEEIRRRCRVVDVVEKMREARLRWYGHVKKHSVNLAITPHSFLVIVACFVHLSHCVDLKGLHGTFTSPQFPNPYPDNSYQVWDISVPEGHRIKLYFTHFSLEPSYLCEYDYMQDLVNSGTFLSNVSCSRRFFISGIDMTMSCNEVTKFASNSTLCLAFAGNRYNSGLLTLLFCCLKPVSLNWHKPETLTVSVTSAVTACLRAFEVSSSADKRAGAVKWFKLCSCSTDINECKLAVDGEPYCDHNCHNYVGGYYCTCRLGYHLHSNKRTCTGKLNYLVLLVHLNKGLFFSVFLKQKSSSQLNRSNSSFQLMSRLLSLKRCQVACSKSHLWGIQCSNQVFTERSGELTSPDYPSAYPKLSQCTYRIRLDEGFSLILEFVESFDVESHPDVSCPYDVLKISTKKKEYGPFCGSSLPKKIETGSNEVEVLFRTDGSGTNKGWKIKYSSTATPCPDPVVPPHGRILPLLPQYIFKDSFTLTCEKGYELLQGSKELPNFRTTCRKDGTWDQPMPRCSIVDCAQPDEILNGQVSASTTTFQSVLRYTCKEPFYKMKGDADGRYTCASDGYWRDSKGRSDLPECEPTCGTPTSGKLARIIGGSQAGKNEFPWQVLVIVGQEFKGGASLISDNWVLTAAHVLHGHGDVANVELKMGITERADSNAVVGVPEKIFIHDRYKQDGVNYDHDIALVKLSNRVPISSSVMPICLPQREDRFLVKQDDVGVVSGWGVSRKSGRGPGSVHLRYVELPVVDFEVCKAGYRDLGAEIKHDFILTENMICAGIPQGGKDTCHGDSGGPFAFYDDGKNSWYIGGIVSWGYECAKAGQYGVYTKVTNYVSWINDVISSNR